MIAPDLTYEAIASWIAPMPDDQIVGRKKDSSACPLAELARAQGVENPLIEDDRVTFGPWGLARKVRSHTPFTERCVKQVDRLGSSRRVRVRAGDMRRILAELAAMEERT